MKSILYEDQNVEITSVAFSKGGDYLAVGFENGHLEVVDGVTLQLEGCEEDASFFDYSSAAISEIKFSHNSKFLAYCVSLLPWS